jgi:hypothetical protein
VTFAKRPSAIFVFLRLLVAALLGSASLWACGSALGADLVDYSLCDVRVLYLFDDPARIDWPTLYYLNDHWGCRVDLVSVASRVKFLKESYELKERQLYFHKYYLPAEDSLRIDSVTAELFAERRPDVVILGEPGGGSWYKRLKDRLVNLPASDTLVFNVLKVYELSTRRDSGAVSAAEVVLNSREMQTRYRTRLNGEVPFFIPWYRADSFTMPQLVHYRLVKRNLTGDSTEADFLSGIEPTRLIDIIRRLPLIGPMKATFLKQAGKYVSLFGAASKSVGRRRADLILNGYRELTLLNEQPRFDSGATAYPDYFRYLNDLLSKAERAALDAAGVNWDGRVVLRDSPEGPKLKFTAAVSADGPEDVQLSNIRFHPYWDTAAVILDDQPRLVGPHQSLVQEYLVDIDRSRLESPLPDSLLFSAEIAYGQIPLRVFSAIPVRESPQLGIAFDPSFHFVPPVAQLEVDRVVSSMNWKVIITKPYEFSGKVGIDLQTPVGLFAGAYRQELTLDAGNTRETVRIPFTVSKLFDPGIQAQTVDLLVDGRVIAVDTGYVRLAACSIADTVKIGFLPDTTGLLEDILRQTDAGFQPLTDRTFLTADLDPWDVIVVGSGSFRDYPALAKVRDRLQEYVRYGGSIVVFGQPEDWPEGLLPVSLIPLTGQVAVREEIGFDSTGSRLWHKPYDIDRGNLLAYFAQSRPVAAAIVSPAEKIMSTASGAALVSVSRIGDGQIIYCGLPLLEAVAQLELTAIHLFANILNY